MKNFALIGAAGYIAPKHFGAIKNTGNNLIAALDKADSVGVIDSYFPDADFFIEFERFDRHLDKLRRKRVFMDYLSVCTPNYLHDSHIRFGLKHGANVICEKPLVLNPWNIEGLQEIERETSGKIFTILQLRHHPSIVALKKQVDHEVLKEKYDIELTYITSRGKWYYSSWKGDITKSGGIATNIGIHFFDMLSWIFGMVEKNIIHVHTHDRASGYLELKNARIRWFLSIDEDTLPLEIKKKGMRTFRSINVSGHEIEFTNGFTDLHQVSYEEILAGKGYELTDVMESIEITHEIRQAKTSELKGEYHPMAKGEIKRHPFFRDGN